MREHAKRIVNHALSDHTTIQTMIDRGLKPEMFEEDLPDYFRVMTAIFHFYLNGKYPLTYDSIVDQIETRSKGDVRKMMLDAVNASYDYDGISSIPDLEHAIESVIKANTRRVVMTNVANLLNKLSGSPDIDIEQEIMNMLEAVANQRTRSRFSSLSASSKEVIGHIGKMKKGAKDGSLRSYHFGIPQLDVIAAPYHPGWLIVIGGGPNQGKTHTAKSIARNRLIEGDRILWITAEESKQEVEFALVSGLTVLRGLPVGTKEIMEGTASADQIKHLIACHEEFKKWKLYTWEVGSITPSQIQQKIRSLQAIEPLDAVFVDYIQLINSDTKNQSTSDRVKEVTRSLKLIAKDEQVPMIALSQMKREAMTEAFVTGRYNIDGFSESSEVEKSCDLGAWILVTPQMKMTKEMSLGVVKNRHGPTTDDRSFLLMTMNECALIRGESTVDNDSDFVDGLIDA